MSLIHPKVELGSVGGRLGLLVIAIVLSGCDQSRIASMDLYPVKGQVRLADGKPLTSGRIVFSSTKSTITFMAPVESDGGFTVKGSNGSGLPEGDYKVRLEMDETKLPQVKGQPNPRKSALPFPVKYLDEDQSGLTATIKAGENPPLEFRLKK